jgi:hypothetical protein
MVTMAVAPGRRDACREMVDQRSWCERQRRGAVALSTMETGGQPVDDMVGVTQFQTLKREGWACAVAQQPLPVPKRGRRDPARPRAPSASSEKPLLGWVGL